MKTKTKRDVSDLKGAIRQSKRRLRLLNELQQIGGIQGVYLWQYIHAESYNLKKLRQELREAKNDKRTKKAYK